MELRKLLNQLPEPKDEIEKISYQTILPYYDPELINEYNRVVSGMGDGILKMLQEDIDHLKSSKKTFDALKLGALGKVFGPKISWKSHIKRCGWNVSGRYSYKKI